MTFLNSRDDFIWDTESFKGLNLILNSTKVVLQGFPYLGTTYSGIFDPVILNTHTQKMEAKNKKDLNNVSW